MRRMSEQGVLRGTVIDVRLSDRSATDVWDGITAVNVYSGTPLCYGSRAQIRCKKLHTFVNPTLARRGMMIDDICQCVECVQARIRMGDAAPVLSLFDHHHDDSTYHKSAKVLCFTFDHHPTTTNKQTMMLSTITPSNVRLIWLRHKMYPDGVLDLPDELVGTDSLNRDLGREFEVRRLHVPGLSNVGWVASSRRHVQAFRVKLWFNLPCLEPGLYVFSINNPRNHGNFIHVRKYIDVAFGDRYRIDDHHVHQSCQGMINLKMYIGYNKCMNAGCENIKYSISSPLTNVDHEFGSVDVKNPLEVLSCDNSTTVDTPTNNDSGTSQSALRHPIVLDAVPARIASQVVTHSGIRVKKRFPELAPDVITRRGIRVIKRRRLCR
jgi:hypothetical protein